MSKNQAIVYAALNLKQYALSIEGLARLCGLDYAAIEEALVGLYQCKLIKSIKYVPSGRIVYRSRQLPVIGSAA